MRHFSKRLGKIPWWFLALLSLVCLGTSLHVHSSILSHYEAQVRAAIEGPPKPVDLTMFRASRDVMPSGEVSLTVQVAPERAIELGGLFSGPRYVLPLFGSTDGPGAAPRAGLIVDAETFGGIDDYIQKNFLSTGRAGSRIMVNGLASTSGGIVNDVAQAFAAQGTAPPATFAVVSPFMLPRVVVLAPRPTLFWTVTVLPMAFGVLLARRAFQNWCTTPLGMYAELKARQRWRRIVRSAGLKPLSARQRGNTVLFNPFAWLWGLRVVIEIGRRLLHAVAAGFGLRRQSAVRWVDQKTEVKLVEQDPFTRFQVVANAQPGSKRPGLQGIPRSQRRRRAV